MIVESLVFSRLTTSLGASSTSKINWLYNRAVCIVCGLCKSEHVFRYRHGIHWHSVLLLTQHHTVCAMLDQYTNQGILLDHPI